MEKFEHDIISSLNILQEGGIILYPTDTIWGIGCDATNTVAIKKIYRLKRREENKSMIILLQDEIDINKYVLHPSKKIIDFLLKQTHPTTAIFNDAVNLPGEIINKDGTIAIRIVQDGFCKELINRLGYPLVSTSANISGEQPPQNFREIRSAIKNGVDYIVQHRQTELGFYHPSSIIQLKDGDINKIR